MMIVTLRSKISGFVSDASGRLAGAPAPGKAGAAALILLLAAGVAIPLTGGTAEAKQYSTAPVVRGAVEVRVDAKGVVQPEHTVRVIAPGAGTVTSVAVAPGARVKRGQVLARIAAAPVVVRDDRPASDAGSAGPAKAPAGSDNAAKADLESAKAQLEAARARRDAAKKEADKLAAIPDLVPRLQIEAAKRDADAAQAAFEVASARVRATEAAPSAAKAPRPAATPGPARPTAPRVAPAGGELVVSAPIDGVVISRNAEKGQTIKGAPTLFMIGDADSAVEIRVAIPRDEASGLVDGMPALASTAYDPDRTFEGRLTGLDGHTADGGAVAAVLQIADADFAALAPGTKVDVDVKVDGRENVLVVPAAALHFTPERDAREAAETSVWVRAANGALVERQVEAGLDDGTSVEIVSGLREGDLVVTGEAGAPAAAPTAPSPAVIVEAAEDGAALAVAPDFAFARTPEVEALLRYYASDRGREATGPAFARSSALRGRAEEIFREEGVPTNLVWLAQVESGWRSSAVSPVGAAGVWQFMPYTAERFGLRVDDQVDERYDFEKATRAAAQYLRVLSERYHGNWELAIGAYNCGEGAMDSAIERAGGAANFWTLARAGVLPDETARYVPAVLAATIVGTELG
jgi:multidrug efflux pump subunit AcrA (membrane-fusion protein)